MAEPSFTNAYDDFLTWLVMKATPEEILSYTLPDEVAERAIELLERNNAGTLTESEAAELEAMRRADALISLLKARSLDALAQP